MDLKQTCDAIKELKIQGAENVATAALKALEDTLRRSKAKNKLGLLREMEAAKTKLFATRPTEPQMRNYVESAIHFLKTFPEQDVQAARHATAENIKRKLKEKQEWKERLVDIGSILLLKVIRQKKLIIYTHCHSGSVTAIIRKASKKKRIEVHNTETRPLYQGRLTAKELAKARISVQHYVDSSVIEAMKEANLIMIGADAVTFDGVYNKVGSEMVALLAKQYHVPLYVCTSVWKFDPHHEVIEQRKASEVWEHPPKGVKIQNPAFEKIPLKLIKRFVCEEGILKPKRFIKKARGRLKHTKF